MYFVLTTAGHNYIAQHQGSLPILTEFKLGSGFNYLPSESQTGLVGSQVYAGIPSAPYSISQNVIRYTVFIDYNAPSFLFGEIVLYLPGNIAFAIGAASSLVAKSQISGISTGSSIAIDCYIPSSIATGYYPYASLANSSNELMIQSVGALDLLPAANEAVPNIYSVPSAAETRQSTLAVSDNTLWSISDYTMYTDSLSISGLGAYSIDLTYNPASPLAIPDPNSVYGEVLLQIIDGRAIGTIRVVRSYSVIGIGNTRRYTFDTPLNILPNIGDSLRIYVKTLQGGKYWNLLNNIDPSITSSHLNALVSDPVNVMVRADGARPLTANWSIGNHRLVNLANPIGQQDAVNLQTLSSSISNALTNYQHNSVSNIQGGLTTERYHLSNADYTKLTTWTTSGVPEAYLPSASTSVLGLTRLASTQQTADGVTGLYCVTPSSLNSALSSSTINTLQSVIINKVKELNPLTQTGLGAPSISTPSTPSLYIDISTPAVPVSYAYNTTNATWYKIASAGASDQPISTPSLTVTGPSSLASITSSSTLDISGTSSLTGNVVLGTTTNNTLLVKSTTLFNSNLSINASTAYPIRLGSNSTLTNLGIGQGASDVSIPLSNISTGINNVAIGKGAGGLLSSGSYNVLVGSGAGTILSTSTSSTFIGNDSGRLSTASSNTGVGNSALYNSSGFGSTAVGSAALYSNTTGSNTGIGYQAGQSINTGTGNTILGRGALYSSTNGNYNTAIGHNSLTLLNNNNNPGPCTAVGYGTLASITTGGINTAIGYNALTSAVTTTKTIAIGDSALSTYTGTGNILFIGSVSTGSNIPNTATSSVILGTDINSGSTDATQYNVSIGNQVGLAGSRNIAIGTYARGEVISNSTGNVTIGDFASYADQGAGISYTISIGSSNNAYATNSISIGRGSNTKPLANASISLGYLATIYGANNIAIGQSSGVDTANTVPSTSCIAIGSSARATGTGSIAIGNGVQVTATNSILIGAGNTNATANSVVIGSSSHTTYNIHTANWTNISDARDKKEIQSLDLGLGLINKLRPVKFKWNLRDGGRVDDADSGFIAQEVLEAVGPEAGEYFRVVDSSDSEQLRLSASYLIPVLVNAVQELTAEVELLKREIRKV